MQIPSTNTYISVVHLNYMDEAWKALSIIVPSCAVIFGRWLSNKEHRKTEKKVNDIYIIVNGGLQKKLDEAREQGRQEILNQNK